MNPASSSLESVTAESISIRTPCPQLRTLLEIRPKTRALLHRSPTRRIFPSALLMKRSKGSDPSPNDADDRTFRSSKASSRDRGAGAGREIVERVRGILSARNLTLYRVSALAKAMYPREPGYHVPRNFYFQLRSKAWNPTIHQLVALSRVSGYRFVDWLAVFGFRLGSIPRLQSAFPYPRTTLLDSSLYDEREPIPWFEDRLASGKTPPVSPLSQLLEPSGERRLGSFVVADRGPYYYVKIGRQDAFAFPDLLPGSIVRANPRLMEQMSPTPPGKVSKHIFLIEHSRGLCCCRLFFETGNRVALMATQLPFANVEMELGSEAKILGVLDMEFRPTSTHRRIALSSCAPTEVAPDLAKHWAPGPLKQQKNDVEPLAALLLRGARLRASLSLRRASEMSRVIANALGDEQYFASPAWLSDFEAKALPPRHIHKLLTVSILYPIRFFNLLNSLGLALSSTPTAPIPDEWMNGLDRQVPAEEIAGNDRPSASGFLTTTLRRIGGVPFFLWRSLPSLCGLSEISLRDVFWVGGQLEPLHPTLAGALFVVIDRRKQRPRIFRRKAPWEQPVYLVARRDGSYLLASCNLENSTIVVHPYTEGFVRPERLRDRVDAHVVGQIVTVIRSLPSPP